MKQKYELMVILSSLITDKEIKAATKTIKALLGDEIVYEEIWGMRNFAYRIKKQDKGYYIVWNFSSDPASVKNLDKDLNLMPEVLRYLLLKVKPNYSPLSLKEIETGLEALREKKSAKRGEVQNAMEKRAQKEAENHSKPAPKQEKNTDATPVESEEKPESLDEKLDKIINEDNLDV